MLSAHGCLTSAYILPTMFSYCAAVSATVGPVLPQ